MSSPAQTPVPPQPPQASPNNTVWWVLGLLVAAVVTIGAAAMFFAGMIARQVRVSQGVGSVEIRSPAGAIKVNAGDAHATGLPVYPGANRLEGSAASVEVGEGKEKTALFAAEHYTSGDPLDKISDWYRQRLGHDFRESHEQATLSISTGGANIGPTDIAFVSDRGDPVLVVGLTKRMNGVEISLVRVGKREAQ